MLAELHRSCVQMGDHSRRSAITLAAAERPDRSFYSDLNRIEHFGCGVTVMCDLRLGQGDWSGLRGG